MNKLGNICTLNQQFRIKYFLGLEGSVALCSLLLCGKITAKPLLKKWINETHSETMVGRVVPPLFCIWDFDCKIDRNAGSWQTFISFIIIIIYLFLNIQTCYESLLTESLKFIESDYPSIRLT
jgi:hypothetical protein